MIRSQEEGSTIISVYIEGARSQTGGTVTDRSAN